MNPRYPFGVYTISNRARSASYATSPNCVNGCRLAYNTTCKRNCQEIFIEILKNISGMVGKGRRRDLFTFSPVVKIAVMMRSNPHQVTVRRTVAFVFPILHQHNKKQHPSERIGVILAEKEGFEPSIPFWGIHDFQSCALGQLRDFSISTSTLDDSDIIQQNFLFVNTYFCFLWEFL